MSPDTTIMPAAPNVPKSINHPIVTVVRYQEEKDQPVWNAKSWTGNVCKHALVQEGYSHDSSNFCTGELQGGQKEVTDGAIERAQIHMKSNSNLQMVLLCVSCGRLHLTSCQHHAQPCNGHHRRHCADARSKSVKMPSYYEMWMPGQPRISFCLQFGCMIFCIFSLSELD